MRGGTNLEMTGAAALALVFDRRELVQTARRALAVASGCLRHHSRTEGSSRLEALASRTPAAAA